jgi:hypothetical protein
MRKNRKLLGLSVGATLLAALLTTGCSITSKAPGGASGRPSASSTRAAAPKAPDVKMPLPKCLIKFGPVCDNYRKGVVVSIPEADYKKLVEAADEQK